MQQIQGLPSVDTIQELIKACGEYPDLAKRLGDIEKAHRFFPSKPQAFLEMLHAIKTFFKENPTHAVNTVAIPSLAPSELFVTKTAENAAASDALHPLLFTVAYEMLERLSEAPRPAGQEAENNTAAPSTSRPNNP